MRHDGQSERCLVRWVLRQRVEAQTAESSQQGRSPQASTRASLVWSGPVWPGTPPSQTSRSEFIAASLGLDRTDARHKQAPLERFLPSSTIPARPFVSHPSARLIPHAHPGPCRCCTQLFPDPYHTHHHPPGGGAPNPQHGYPVWRQDKTHTQLSLHQFLAHLSGTSAMPGPGT